jgi:hypothetical protein
MAGFLCEKRGHQTAQQMELEAVGRVVEVRQLHEVELLTLDGVVGDRVCASRTG